MKVTIFGAGAWGTAIALYCHSIGHEVMLVAKFKEQADIINQNKENIDFLPGVSIPDDIIITSETHIGFEHCEVAFIGCPSKGLVDLCEELRNEAKISGKHPFVLSLCKGIQFETMETPTKTVSRLLPGFEIGVFAGPTNAKEIAIGKHAGMVLASESPRTIDMQRAFNSKQIRVYRNNDMTGVELGGCLKNVYAIGAGICDGLEFGDNAKAGYLTRAMRELVTIGMQMGGQRETFYGLSGLGDFIVTCTGIWSRNRTFGEKIGRGEKIDDIFSNQKAAVEGYKTTKSFYELCKKNDIDAPIIKSLYEILYEDKNIKEAIECLIYRDIKPEA